MSDKRYLGNIITPTPTAPAGPYESDAAPGVWSLQAAYTYIKAETWPTAGNVNPDSFIENLFSTYLYTGNGSTQTITNGIDLAGEGGLVWQKSRVQADDHRLSDTERGANNTIRTNNTGAEFNISGSNSVSQFNSDGFVSGLSDPFFSGEPIASWTFRKAPRFFDVVTYTGDWTVGRTVAHNLGVAPAVIIVKSLSEVRNWFVYHRSLGATKHLHINTADAEATQTDIWNDTEPTDTHFTLGDSSDVNSGAGGGQPYVAYLFAHDPLGPSGDGSDGLIACGSYTGNGSTTGPSVNLGWEPQWVIIKKSSDAESWYIYDSMRGVVTGAVSQADRKLLANATNAEGGLAAADPINFGATGFNIGTTDNELNNSGSTYIYIAIRRGPMREPTSGTQVFSPQTAAGVQTTNFVVDAFIGVNNRTSLASYDPFTRARLLGGALYLTTSSTAAEGTGSDVGFDSNTGLKFSWGSAGINWYFRRAPGFFDVVAYQGNNVAGRTVSHNLGVAPELMIVKSRQITNSWFIYHKDLGATYAMNFDTSAAFVNTASWNSTAPTSSVFTLGGTGGGTNAATSTFIAYLFATLPGVSKVGSYTGNGSSQTIDCGFTSGARFVLIKRTDSTGDWYVWDSARGIVAGNDPHLSLNTTAAEVTTDDSVDAESSGFIVNQDAATNVNVATASYIFLAVA